MTRVNNPLTHLDGVSLDEVRQHSNDVTAPKLERMS